MRKADPVLQQQRSSQIVEAAGRVFLERGFHGAGVQDIAREAGVSMGLLYRYFANKEAIIAAVALRDRAAEIARIRRAGEPADALGALRQLALDMLSDSKTAGYIPLVTEIAAEALRNPAIADIMAREEVALMQALRGVIEKRCAAGQLSPRLDASSAATAFLTLVDGLAFRAALHEIDARTQARAIDLLLGGFAADASTSLSRSAK